MTDPYTERVTYLKAEFEDDIHRLTVLTSKSTSWIQKAETRFDNEMLYAALKYGKTAEASALIKKGVLPDINRIAEYDKNSLDLLYSDSVTHLKSGFENDVNGFAQRRDESINAAKIHYENTYRQAESLCKSELLHSALVFGRFNDASVMIKEGVLPYLHRISEYHKDSIDIVLSTVGDDHINSVLCNLIEKGLDTNYESVMYAAKSLAKRGAIAESNQHDFLKDLTSKKRLLSSLIDENIIDPNHIFGAHCFTPHSLKFLFDHGANPDRVVQYHKDSLPIIAFSNIKLEGAELLLQQGANPNVLINDGPPLMRHLENSCYCAEDRDKWIKLFCKFGADVNLSDSKERTALHKAAKEEQLGTVRTLINHGADIFIKDKDGKTPMDYASGSLKDKMIEMVAQKEANGLKKSATTPKKSQEPPRPVRKL